MTIKWLITCTSDMHYSDIYFNTYYYFFPGEIILKNIQKIWFLDDLHWKWLSAERQANGLGWTKWSASLIFFKLALWSLLRIPHLHSSPGETLLITWGSFQKKWNQHTVSSIDRKAMKGIIKIFKFLWPAINETSAQLRVCSFDMIHSSLC